MLFDSLSFFIFFPVVTFLYFVFPKKYKWVLLLSSSCYFYMAFVPSYIFILIFLILIDYSVGILLAKTKGKKRKIIFLTSIISNVGMLFVYKYFNFASYNIHILTNTLHLSYPPFFLSLILPIGLSFHTFQSMSYVIEVYKKRQKPEKNLGIYALFVMFYPQLVAGPIERPQQLLPQLHKSHNFNADQVRTGLIRMAIGLFKKAVIADTLALTVNTIYGNPFHYVGLPLVIATIAFAFQIYCDFSGYTDIAIGSAQVMGFHLVENFNYPYLARSIRDFWRRWNMSLYAWFRDYVYIPLGGNRISEIRTYINILIVFFLTGLWHGANYTYILWGLLNGIYMVVNSAADKYILARQKIAHVFLWSKKLTAVLQTVITFTLVCIAWVFFRANNMDDVRYILTHAGTGLGNFIRSLLGFNLVAIQTYIFKQGEGLGINGIQIGIIFASLTMLGIIEYLIRNNLFYKSPVWVRWTIAIIIVFMIINFQAKDKVPFIYFQF